MNKPIYLFSISSHPKAIHINPLEIKFLDPKIDFSTYDYLIITSKQASKALENYNTDSYIDKKALCISKASAKSYEDIGGTVLDIGAGYGDTLVDKIKNYPKEIRWVYLRAKVVASDFVEVLKKDGYSIDEVIVYESFCSSYMNDLDIEDDAVLIFTSPSSVDCFLKQNSIKSSQKIIVIGKTTAKALPEYVDFIISNETTIQSCIDLID